MKYIIRLPFFIFLILVSFSIAFSKPASDTLKKNVLTDTTKTIIKNDSTAKDTVKPYIPLRNHGSIFLLPNSSLKKIRKGETLFDIYNSMSELLYKRMPVYPLFLGSTGKYNTFSAFGGTHRDNSFSFNGRQLYDAAFGTINPEQFSPEFFEQAEILTGSDAIVFSDNASGILINYQEIKYNTAKPYSKLWYSEGGFGFTGADGIISQNIMKNVNFTFGFGKLTSKGRYNNSWNDNWNARGLLRWNLSEKTNISFVENFHNSGNGTNGGLNPYQTASLYDENSAVPYFEFNNERVFRHDISTTVTSYLDKDTTQAFSAGAFFTYAEWNRFVPEEAIINKATGTSSQKYFDRQSGVNVRYESSILKHIFLSFGGEMNLINLERSDYNDEFAGLKTSTFAYTRLELFPALHLSGGVRYINMGNHTALNFGAKGTFSITESFSFYADVSRYERFPSMSESFSLVNEKGYLELAGLSWKSKETSIEIGAFARQISDPILSGELIDTNQIFVSTFSVNGINRNVIGGNLNFSTKLYNHVVVKLSGQTYLLSKTDDIADKRFPLGLGKITTYYELLMGQSVLNLGVSFTATTKFKGESFVPQTRNFIQNEIESTHFINGLDVFATARLGNAFVRISYENILSNGYYYVPFYPAYDRNFRLLVSWAFLN